MAPASLTLRMSVEEYLHTAFHPDVDFVDGLIEERNLGEFDHARLQGILFAYFFAKETEWKVYAIPECRVQVAATRFRIPDICLTDATQPIEQIIRRPPLLCVEVVSPEDRLPRILARARDFHQMGVSAVWIFDPSVLEVRSSTPDGVEQWTEGPLTVPETPIQLDPAEAFARLMRGR